MSKVVEIKRCIIVGRGQSRNQSGRAGPHEILAGLLGKSAGLGVVVKTIGLMSTLIIVLDYPGRELTGPILLTRPLRERRAADHRHGCAGPVMHQVWGRRDTRTPVIGVQRVVVAISHLTASGCQVPTKSISCQTTASIWGGLAGCREVIILRILSKL